MKSIDQLREEIIGAAIEVHREKRTGFAAYEACLSHELGLRGVTHARQVAVPLIYKGMTLEIAFRADTIVGQRVSWS